MNGRNIFVAAMLILIVALGFYLVDALKIGGEEEITVTPMTSGRITTPESIALVSTEAQPMPETESRLRDLQAQQGAQHQEELSLLYLVKCSACHGRDGRGPVGPPISGKSKEENLAILMKYKNKQVTNSAMLGLLEQTDDKELEMLAEEITAF
ncbi:MAG: hypothetical protein LBS40_00360 [Burkholderiales bacterium]|jgi:cytochrome c553|nr:hypothetical protein [Burkholderiales bacterium]